MSPENTWTKRTPLPPLPFSFPAQASLASLGRPASQHASSPQAAAGHSAGELSAIRETKPSP